MLYMSIFVGYARGEHNYVKGRPWPTVADPMPVAWRVRDGSAVSISEWRATLTLDALRLDLSRARER
jgi:hypothetical protein